MKSVSMSIPTTRVTPITEQQLWLTVCVKNWGVAWFHAGGFGNGSLDVGRQVHVDRLGAKEHFRGVARGPCGKDHVSAPSRSRESLSPFSSDATTASEVARTKTAMKAMRAVMRDPPKRPDDVLPS